MKKRMVNRTFYLPERDLEFLERLVEEGYYASVSDAVRYAIKQLIRYHVERGMKNERV